jgi:hypothetical protein
MASKNQKQLETAKAKELIQENARKYFTSKVKIPLGNPALKNVHTNQFLWMDLPKEFAVDNWELIAKVLNGSSTRFSGVDYVNTRWYIEGCTIDVDVSGKAEMSLDLNAFASSTSEFTADYRSYKKAYDDVVNKASSNNNSSTKKKTNAVTNTNNNNGALINESWVKKYNIDKRIVDKVKSICKEGKSQYDNVRAIFKWSDANLPYEGYSNTKYGAVGTMLHGAGNCVDHAHLFAAMCRCLGVKCNYIHNTCCGRGGHVYNIVYFDGKGTIVDTGRDCASWGSHWGNDGCPVEKTSINF